MPEMAIYFGVADSVIQHSLSAFQLGLVCATLVAGPLSDAYGRRPLLLMGLGIFLLASILLVIPTGIDAFLAWRLLQGCGAGVSLGMGQAVVRDAFHERESVQIFSKMFTYVLLTPAIAPVLGAYLTTSLGWRSCFVFIALSVFATFVATYLFFPETHPPSLRNRLRPDVLRKNLRRLVNSREFILFDLVSVLPFSGLWFYRTAMPFVFIKYMGVSIHMFGYYVFAHAMIQSATSYYVQRVVDRIGIFKMISIGIMMMLVSSLLVFVSAELAPEQPMLAALAVLPFMMGILFTTPTSSAKTMSYGEHSRGVASSVLASSRQVSIAFGAFMAAFLPHDTFVPAGIFMGVVAILAGVAFQWAKKVDADL